jgi:hypothetical protein
VVKEPNAIKWSLDYIDFVNLNKKSFKEVSQMLCKINDYIKRFKEFVKDKKGSAEIIAFAILLMFIIIALAPKIKDIGSTISSGTDTLNQDLQQQLSSGQ